MKVIRADRLYCTTRTPFPIHETCWLLLHLPCKPFPAVRLLHSVNASKASVLTISTPNEYDLCSTRSSDTSLTVSLGTQSTMPSPNRRLHPPYPVPPTNTQYTHFCGLGRAPQIRRRRAGGGAGRAVRWHTRFFEAFFWRCARPGAVGTGRIRQLQGNRWSTLLGRERLVVLA